MKKYLVEIKGDMNDADYRTNTLIVDESKLEEIKMFLKKLNKAFGPLSSLSADMVDIINTPQEYKDCFRESISKGYNSLSDELYDLLEISIGSCYEYAVHSIVDITAHEIISSEKLL